MKRLIKWKTNTKYLIGSSSSSELLSFDDPNATTDGITFFTSAQLGTISIFSLLPSRALATCIPLLEFVGASDLPFVDSVSFEWRLSELPAK